MRRALRLTGTCKEPSGTLALTGKLDGGGSAALVRDEAPGSVRVVSSPANFQVPGWERSVANHLGIRARKLAEL